MDGRRYSLARLVFFVVSFTVLATLPAGERVMFGHAVLRWEEPALPVVAI